MSGYGGGLFGPNDPVSREQMAMILWHSAGSPAAGWEGTYSDASMISAYAAAVIAWASASSIKASNKINS